jgi:hypothetical protein
MKEVSNFRISGHETFALRYAWLPKVVKALDEEPKLFQDEDSAMVTLGVGKNMVRSIKFWGECFSVINQDIVSKDYRVTTFGKNLLGVSGYDPYLEHPATLWLLHWQLCHTTPSLLAWDFLFNHWPYQELKPDRLVSEIKRYPPYGVEAISDNTIESNINVFLHTYAQRREQKNMSWEETLDSPLTELGLIRRYSGDDRTRDTFMFQLEARPELPMKLFCWSVLQFIENKGEGTVSSFQEFVTGNNSPGRIFRLTEQSVRERMLQIEGFSKGVLKSEETASTHVIIRKRNKSAAEFLKDVF